MIFCSSSSYSNVLAFFAASSALLQNKNLGFAVGNGFVDSEIRPGATYRYTVVLEKDDRSLAPRSAPVEISIPELPAD